MRKPRPARVPASPPRLCWSLCSFSSCQPNPMGNKEISGTGNLCHRESMSCSLWHILTVEIAIAIGVEFLVFSPISVPIPIWIPIATSSRLPIPVKSPAWAPIRHTGPPFMRHGRPPRHRIFRACRTISRSLQPRPVLPGVIERPSERAVHLRQSPLHCLARRLTFCRHNTCLNVPFFCRIIHPVRPPKNGKNRSKNAVKDMFSDGRPGGS